MGDVKFGELNPEALASISTQPAGIQSKAPHRSGSLPTVAWDALQNDRPLFKKAGQYFFVYAVACIKQRFTPRPEDD